MKKLRTITLLILSLTLLPCVLCACQPKQPQEPPKPPAPLATVELAQYTLTISQESENDLMQYVYKDFRNVLKEHLNGQLLDFRSDMQPVRELEILIGRTNRPESAEFLSGLRYRDYGYTVINNKIVIAGHTDEGTKAAIQLFQAEILGSTGENGRLVIQSASVFRATYAHDNLLLGSTPVNGMKVVYPVQNQHFEKDYATRIALLLSEASGYYVPVYPDNKITVTDADKLLLVGNTSISRMSLPGNIGVEESYLASNENTVLASGKDALGLYGAIKVLCNSISTCTSDQIALPEDKWRADDGDVLTVMSFNVLVSERSDVRDGRVISMIERYQPDSLGVQEASPNWMETLDAALSAEYDHVGLGRDGDTNGEYTAIFYLKDKFNLLDWGTKWLSDTPDEVSKIPESSLNRTLTYAVLERKSDGKVFVHVNTHLDHTNDTARTKQVKIMLELLKQFKDLPVYVTGDFNCAAGTSPYNEIVNAGFTPSFELAETANRAETYHNYQNLKGDQYIIDFCFVKPSKNMILLHRVCNEKINGNYASDHHPIITQFLLP